MATGWSEEEVYHQGDRFFDAWIDAIERASRSVELETFIFDDDPVGQRFAAALGQAARRGVRVRLCVDGVGSWRFESRYRSELTAAGVECRIFHPLPWQSSRKGWAQSLARLNRRNHRKLCIIDHEVAFVGSLNLSAVHSERHMGGRAWRDVGVQLRGKPIVWLRAAFETVWQPRRRARYWKRLSERASRLSQDRFGRACVELTLSRASRRRKNREFCRRISEATSRVWLVNPYFVPSVALLQALKTAASKRIDVRIILPAQSDHFFMPLVSRGFYRGLLRSGVKIHEFVPSMIHAKTVVIDDWVRVGSSNLNHRSIVHDLEVNVVLRSEPSIRSVVRQFEEDQARSREITLESHERFLVRLKRALSSWLGIFKWWL